LDLGEVVLRGRGWAYLVAENDIAIVFFRLMEGVWKTRKDMGL
jgi:hypothetical protein